jgi:cadmium resistance protein CadD (predicted permease)
MDAISGLTTVGVGVSMFVSTNIDDIFLLAAFFASRLAARTIVIGQLLGIGGLVAMSAAAAAAAIVVPARWLALLGLIPLVLGIREALRLGTGASDDDDDDDEARNAVAHARSQVLAVTAVTVANGGDNLAVYIPVFANDLSAVPLYAAIFGLMTLVWCAAGHALVNNPVAGGRIRLWGRVLLPAVLIALGLWLLAGAVFPEEA